MQKYLNAKIQILLINFLPDDMYFVTILCLMYSKTESLKRVGLYKGSYVFTLQDGLMWNHCKCECMVQIVSINDLYVRMHRDI